MVDSVAYLPNGHGIDDPEIEKILEFIEVAGIESLTEEEEAIYNEYAASEKPDTDHYANLADHMDDGTLSKMAQQIEDWVEKDDQSRQDWRRREARGIKLLGVSDRTEGGANFDGASRVVHPLLIEAITQFHSRAIAELWPAEGPVKTQVLGLPTAKANQQAERVQDYLNYLYTVRMPGAFDEEDRLLFRLPMSGSCFKKIYYCPLEDSLMSRMIDPEDFIVPYSATDLRTTPRYTHRFYEQLNDIKKKVYSKYYRNFEPTISGQTPEYHGSELQEEIDSAEGRTDNEDTEQPHTMYEMYVDLELSDFPDIDEETGEETGIARPYIVTVDKDEQTVLRIQRNWRPQDQRKKKKLNTAHYKFSPGFGFYGFGLLHLIGGLTIAATGALRSLLDAAAFANMQGGYRSRDARIEGGDRPIAPGEWREVNSTSEELKRSFFAMPYKEPSKTLFELLGYLDERGQRFASTTENMVGEANNSAPVGTTMALIEQGSKVFSAIHKRLHQAHADEFRILHDLNYEYLPEEGYPYNVIGSQNLIMAQDFDGRVDVVPVSDPNIISNTQRIAQSQAALDLAEKMPDVINKRKAAEYMLKAVRFANYEDLMLPESTEPTPQEEAQMLENRKAEAEVSKIEAETVNKAIEGQYSSLQAAQAVATMPQIVPIADELLLSAGYQDMNGAPVATPPALPPAFNGEADINIEGEFPGNPNTNPMTPANPASPVVGVNQGIETMENDL